MTPFAATSATYLDAGLSVMPCGPGTKFPGRYGPDGWHVAHDWQRFCERAPNQQFEVPLWDAWPDAGVCLALGKASGHDGLHLCAVDIDTDDPAIVTAIDAVLPGSPVRKRGAKGETRFYLASASVPNRPFNDANRVRLLDLLCHGRQTVLPPTIHPGTGQPYRWTTLDTLENLAVADLPVLPDDIADRLSEALRPFGHVDAPVLLTPGQADPDAAISTHREINNAALANLAAWVPALQLYKCRQVGGKYKAVAHWRPSSSGRPSAQRAANLAIGPEGIKDCGEGKGYTPLNLVMAACGADLESAFRWLQERVAPVKPVVFGGRVSVEIEEEPRRGNLWGIVQRDGSIMPVQPVREMEEEDAPASVSRTLPRELCMPPGLIGDIVEWIVASDEGDAPELALGATLAFLGSIMGRRYAHPSRRARTNVYVLGLAPTGFGKAHAPTAIKELARASGLEAYLGPGRWKSESAVRKVLEAKPTVCCLVDEAGGVMRDILGKKASEHKAGIRDILLELFSAANSTYTGSEGASEKAVPLTNPNLCIYGTTTPNDLWGNVSSSAAADGFLPRWLIFDVGDRESVDREATADAFDPPAELRRALHAILDVRPKGNLSGMLHPQPIVATWGEGAHDHFVEMKAASKQLVSQANAAGKGTTSMIHSRVLEHAVKLSLMYAVSVDPASPTITVEGFEWGIDVAMRSAAALILGLEGKVADTDGQAQYLWVRHELERAGRHGLLEKELMRRVNGKWDARRHGDILGQLEAAGLIWRGTRTPVGGGRPGQRVGCWTDDDADAEARE